MIRAISSFNTSYSNNSLNFKANNTARNLSEVPGQVARKVRKSLKNDDPCRGMRNPHALDDFLARPITPEDEASGAMLEFAGDHNGHYR